MEKLRKGWDDGQKNVEVMDGTEYSILILARPF